MVEIIDFKEVSRKRLVDKLVFTLGFMYDEAEEIANSYYELMIENPLVAIEKLPNFIRQARNINSVLGEAYAGGPNHDWTGPMLNILGIMYPLLERDARKEGLLKCLNFLEGIRYDYSQNNVELIDEPWLVADIVINRPLYWCGYKEYIILLEKNPKWVDFSQHIDSAKSDFWLTLAITRPKYSSLEIRANFYRQFSDLIDRTEDAIAAIIFNYAQQESQKEEYIEENLLKYDAFLHKDIRKKIEEKKWIKLSS